jgi:ATP-dependent RNA helicase DDX54/DBP10
MATKGKGGGQVGNGFKPLGLSEPVFKGVVRMGFRVPTPVQRKALPVILSGADTVVMARTGSGKTAAFLIPLLETLLANPATSTGIGASQRKGVRGLILSPTRELSLQTLRVLKKLSHFTDIRSIGIHGGEGMENQFDLLSSKPDVIVATPGRLAHHLSEIPDFDLKDCQICILDEADRLLEMGFAMQLRQISRTLPADRCQKVLLSATMPKMLVEFTKGGFTTDPQMVRLDQEATVSEDLRISFITCRSLEKDAVLLQILYAIQDDTEKHKGTRTGLTLIFCATRHHVEYLATLLQASGQKTSMIYGTMDHEARNANLAAFRNGTKPIMVVTDVAARGVDIPFMDHVIHYHFPPTAKLFIHRSGRAARAGRIGYCWSLVEPEELPYMVDLHLFLGRKMTTSAGAISTEWAELEEEAGSEKPKDVVVPYTLSEMTPEMVHYGSVPESILTMEVENVRRIMDSELSGSEHSEAMRALSKVCTNAMKQYRKTRPEASREGVRRAKAILEGVKIDTGERVNGTSIPPHPLLEGLEREHYERQKDKGKIGTLNDLENQKKRQEFLLAMSRLRPKETVFEAFATGGGKETGVGSQVDKGRTTLSSKKNDSSFALSAMKRMRRQMRMARDKGSALVVAGSQNALDQNDEGGITTTKQDQGGTASEGSIPEHPSKAGLIDFITGTAETVPTRRRLSKAERKQIKKDPSGTIGSSIETKKMKSTRETDFRDHAFFIETNAVNNPEESQRQQQVEAAMQPSAANSVKGVIGSALRIEEAMMDIVGDEREEMVQKHRMMRWDTSKRKYIQTTVGAELSGESRSKRLRLESGKIVKTDKMKLGELYEKWQKKTSRSIGRDGVFDTPTTPDDVDLNASTGRRRGGVKPAVKKIKESDSDKPKNAKAIKQERERKQNMKLKNMKKDDRRRLERRQKGGHVGSGDRSKVASKKKVFSAKKGRR